MQPSVPSFSSYTKGLYTVAAISTTACENFTVLTLLLPAEMRLKLEKRFATFHCPTVSIDGAAAHVTFNLKNSNEECFEMLAKIAKDIFSKSALINLSCGSKVSLGLMPSNPAKYLLDSSSVEKVRLIKIEIAKGHQFTKEFAFECKEEVFKRIEKLRYIGLNASGVFIREPRSLQGRYFFLVHIGKTTCEKTLFGQDDLTPGIEFTLSFPYKNS